MKKAKERVECNYCGEIFGKIAIKKHLENCKVRIEQNHPGEEVYYCIQVRGYYKKQYCMYLDVSANTSLKDIDQFLRDRWMECCGHLSMFRIGSEIYDSDPDLYPEFDRNKSMEVQLKDVLFEGLEFMYEYDFGSTTKLELKVLSISTGAGRNEKLILMARNLPFEFVCIKCGKPATQVCIYCSDAGRVFYCDNCCEYFECSEEMVLPVVNSPRMGICGYCGEKNRFIL
jgi:hypothetical protein